MGLQITEYLLSAQSTDANVRNEAVNILVQLGEQDKPAFLLSLYNELSNVNTPKAANRLAGIILKNYLNLDAKITTITDQASHPWIAIDKSWKSKIKSYILDSLGSSIPEERHTAAQLIAKIALIEVYSKDWTELVPSLLTNLTKPNVPSFLKQATLVTLGYVCEDMSHVDFAQDDVNAFLQAIIQGMDVSERNFKVRLAAAKALLNVLDFAQIKFENDTKCNMMKAIFEAASDKRTKIKQAAIECLVSVASNYYDILQPFMQMVLKHSFYMVREDKEAVTVQAVEFWISICDKELEIQDYRVLESGDSGVSHSRLIEKAFPTLVPMLLETLVRLEGDQEQEVEILNLIVSIRTCLGLVSRIVGDAVVPYVMTFVETNISSADWRLREAVTYALGSLLEGPGIEKLSTLLNEGLNILLKAVEEKPKLVKDTTWSLSPTFMLLRSPDSGFSVSVANLPQVFGVLLESIKNAPHVVDICETVIYMSTGNVDPWASSCLLAHYLDILSGQTDEADQTVSNNSKIRPSVYETLNNVVRCSSVLETSQIISVIKGELHRGVTVSEAVTALGEAGDALGSNKKMLFKDCAFFKRLLYYLKSVPEQSIVQMPENELLFVNKEKKDNKDLRIACVKEISEVLPLADMASKETTPIKMKATSDASFSNISLDQAYANDGTKFDDVENSTSCNEMMKKRKLKMNTNEAGEEGETQQVKERKIESVSPHHLLPIQLVDSNVVTVADNTLDQLDQGLPGFLRGLFIDLLNDGIPNRSCRLAVDILKNSLDGMETATKVHLVQQWKGIEKSVKSSLKSHLLNTLGFAVPEESNAVAQLIAWIASLEVPQKEWSELFGALHANITQPDKPAPQKLATLETLRYLCKDISLVDLAMHDVNAIVNAVIQGINACERYPEVRLAAAKALLNALSFPKSILGNKMEGSNIMKVIGDTASELQMEIWQAVLDCLIFIASKHYEELEPYLQIILDLTSITRKGCNRTVAVQAVNFWISICDKELNVQDKVLESGDSNAPLSQATRKALLTLVPWLLETIPQQSEDLYQEDNIKNLAMASRTCLCLVSRTVGDPIVYLVTTFVEINKSKANWRSREAAIYAFGSILKGPSMKKLFPLLNAGLCFLLNALKDGNVQVRYTAAETLCRIFEFMHAPASGFSVITQANLPRILEILLDRMYDARRVEVKVCEAIYYLAKGYENVGQGSSLLNRYLPDIMTNLVAAADRVNGCDFELVTSAHKTVNQVLGSSNLTEIYHIIVKHLSIIISKLEHILNLQNVSSNDRDKQGDLLACLCFGLQVIIVKLSSADKTKPEIMKSADCIMLSFFNVLNFRSSSVFEAAMLATVALARAIGQAFEKYMQNFCKYLDLGLQNFEDYKICIISIDVVCGICGALGDKFSPYCDLIISRLLEDLSRGELHQSVKPAIFSAFGDIALAVGKYFEKYITKVLPVMQRTLQMCVQIDSPDEGKVGHGNQLKHSIFVGYSAILQKSSKSELFLKYERQPEFRKLVAEYQQRDERVTETLNAKGKSKVLLKNDLTSEEGNFKGTMVTISGEEAVAGVIREVDKLSGEVSELVAAVDNGTQVDRKKIIFMTEMLMRQVLKLDAIDAEGEVKLQRRKEVRRVQILVETMDNLKSRNNTLIENADKTNKPKETISCDTGNSNVHPLQPSPAPPISSTPPTPSSSATSPLHSSSSSQPQHSTSLLPTSSDPPPPSTPSTSSPPSSHTLSSSSQQPLSTSLPPSSSSQPSHSTSLPESSFSQPSHSTSLPPTSSSPPPHSIPPTFSATSSLSLPPSAQPSQSSLSTSHVNPQPQPFASLYPPLPTTSHHYTPSTSSPVLYNNFYNQFSNTNDYNTFCTCPLLDMWYADYGNLYPCSYCTQNRAYHY